MGLRSPIAIVAVLARYELMNQGEELHLFGTNYLIDYVWIVPIVHIHEVLVSCYERLLS